MSLAVIPLLLIDIAHHSVDWTKEVHDEISILIYQSNIFTNAEKSQLLQEVYDKNLSYGLQYVLKAVFAVVLLITCIYHLRRYFKASKDSRLKPSLYIAVLFFSFLAVKVFVMPRLFFNPKINLMSFDPPKETFKSFYDKNFKGKVVYIDFWGTTCGPCLYEFKHFNKKLKQHYSGNKKIDFLYICGGNEMRHKYMWREQIKKFNVEGNHIFLNDEEYTKLYNQLAADNKEYFGIPWYGIIDSNGNVSVKNAARPSDKSKLYAQLDSNLVAASK